VQLTHRPGNIVSSRFRAHSPTLRGYSHTMLQICDPTQHTPTTEIGNASSESWPKKIRASIFVLAIVLVVAAICSQALASELVNPPGQRPPQASEKTEASDPLGRNTPNGTVFGFLEAAREGRYGEAAQYLQLPEDSHNRERLANELYVLMEKAFVERVGVISGHVEGSHQIGVSRDRQRIGVFRIDGTDTNVDLVHVQDPTSGGVWLFSEEVIAHVPELFAQVKNGDAEVGSSRPQILERFVSTFGRRLATLLLLVPVSLCVGWTVFYLLVLIVRLILRLRHRMIAKEIVNSVIAPTTVLLAVLLHQAGVYLLDIPLVTRLHYQRITGVLVVISVTWLVIRLVNVWSDQARARTLDSSGYRRGSIILLGQRLSKVVVTITAGLLILSILGFDITTAIAGLGIGSIALAFAAQKTLENVLGGVSILGDEVIRIGEVCKVGDQEGTVEDISLRSTRIRTLEGTVLSVPNGQLANMNLENISRRHISLFRTRMGLKYDTSPAQMRALLGNITSLLRHHSKVDKEGLRVRLVGFGDTSLDVQINCRILTSNLDQFTAIREDLLLHIIELVADAGTALAIPSRLLYLNEEGEQAGRYDWSHSNPRKRPRSA
jgi:MscS family membrane protein